MIKCLTIQTLFYTSNLSFLGVSHFLFVQDHFQNMGVLAASFLILKKFLISFKIKFKLLNVA